MDFDELKRILDMVREHELTEFELERGDLKIRIRKNAAGQLTASLPALPPAAYAPAAAGAYPATPAHGAREAPPVLTGADEELELAVVKSPIVGTFYRSSEPGAAPFAEVGATVKKGQVLCIIEAMKLMNEINSDVDGELVKIYVDNAQPVQYGERLFAIKPAGAL
jgi:acetyl-CoA carboxylase biotin carboxyl carrier protein